MDNISQIVCLIGVCILASCSTEKQLNATAPLEISVSLQKTPCFGDCPVYMFQALNNGRATLTVGRMLQSRFGLELEEGDYEGVINSRELEEILEYAKTIGYFDLAPEYDDKNVMDLPASISSIEGHKVFNRFEGPNLEYLYNLIEDIISKVQWHPISEN